MRKLLLILFFASLGPVNAQQNKISIEFSSGIGAGWWIQESDYKIQNEIITDWANSRLSLDVPLSAAARYKLARHVHIGPGFTFRKFIAKNLYASSPIVSGVTKTKIAVSSIDIMQYYISVESQILKTNDYNLIPKVNLGTFQFESLHPDDGNFTNRFMVEAALQLKFKSKSTLHTFVEIYYSDLSFRTDTSLVFKRVHHIRSIGTKFGIRF